MLPDPYPVASRAETEDSRAGPCPLPPLDALQMAVTDVWDPAVLKWYLGPLWLHSPAPAPGQPAVYEGGFAASSPALRV